MSDRLGDLVAWVTDLLGSLGYAGVAVLIALETLFPPAPLEATLPLAGFLAGQGRLSFVGVVAAATVGSVAGALPLYALGYWFGEARVRRLVRRFGRPLRLQEADVDRAQAWFDRHGGKTVLLGRLIPVPLVRGLIPLPAGLARMPLGRYALYTALGSALRNGLLAGLGWAAGDHWELVGEHRRLLLDGALLAMAAAAIWLVWRRRARR